MKVLCIIDHFGSGGAQRQMAELACGLKRRGHAVEAFTYFPEHDFFYARLTEHGVPVHAYRKSTGTEVGVLRALRATIAGGHYDVAVSYMNTPNVYAELCKLTLRGVRLVVSERCTHHEDPSFVRSIVRRSLHSIADLVVTNTVTHKEWLARHPWLKHKVRCIYNGLDLDRFKPIPRSSSHEGLRLLAVGRVSHQKNLIGLARACTRFFAKHGWVPTISWVGRRDDTHAIRSYVEEVTGELARVPEVAASWHWLGERRDIPELLASHDALILPSLYEGLPNVVCEALAAGRAVLASSVCDNPMLVADAERGFVFDPEDSEAMAAAMLEFARLPAVERERMEMNARRYAENILSIERMVDDYEALFRRLVQRERIAS